MKSEKEITKAIRRYLNLIRIFHYKHWMGGNFSMIKGISDIIGVTRTGRFLAIEVKKEGWEPPKPTNKKEYAHYLDQKGFIDNVNNNNGLAFFASSLDEVIEKLKNIG